MNFEKRRFVVDPQGEAKEEKIKEKPKYSPDTLAWELTDGGTKPLTPAAEKADKDGRGMGAKKPEQK